MSCYRRLVLLRYKLRLDRWAALKAAADLQSDLSKLDLGFKAVALLR